MWPYRDEKRKGLWHRHLVLGMCDEDVVRRFHSIVGVGTVRFRPAPKTKKNWNDQWRWECSRWPHMKRVLTEFLPYLGERRRAKAEEMLAKPPKRWGSEKKDECWRGHKFSGDNLYVAPDGRRNCRACVRIASRKYEKKRRAKARQSGRSDDGPDKQSQTPGGGL